MDTSYIINYTHAADFKGKFVLIAGDAAKLSSLILNHRQNVLSDTALANMKDTYMLSREVLEGYLKYFAIIARVPHINPAVWRFGNFNYRRRRSGTELCLCRGLSVIKPIPKKAWLRLPFRRKTRQRIKRLTCFGP